MTNRPKPKTFMYLALGAAVIGGGACYMQYAQLNATNLRVAALRKSESDPRAVQQQLNDADAQLGQAKSDLQHLEANVSDAAYVPSLMQDLDAFGKANGLAVTGVRPSVKKDDGAKAKESKPYDELDIQVTGQGSFDAIESFIDNLTKFPKIVAARMVSIEPASKVGAKGPEADNQLAVTVNLKAYVFKNGQSAASAAATDGAPAPAPAAKPATPGRTALARPTGPQRFTGRNSLEG